MITRLAILLLTSWTASAATYYIDYASGSDSNNGTTKATPWKRAPGMVGFGASYTHVAGDRFVFKGGVTWPTGCFQWKITKGGTSGALDVYESDPTWYSGGSFTKPLFDFEQRIISTIWYGAGLLVDWPSPGYITFSGLEFANHKNVWNDQGQWGCYTITFNSGDYITLTNSVVRDWTQNIVLTNGVSWVVPYKQNAGGGVIKINDGGGYHNRVTHCVFHQDNVPLWTRGGSPIRNIAYVWYTEVRNTCSGLVWSGQSARFNHIHHLTDPSDEYSHGNAIMVGGSSTIEGNLVHDLEGTCQVFLLPPSWGGISDVYFDVRVWNNVVYNVAQPCVVLDNRNQINTNSLYRVWNNTLEGPYGVGTCIRNATTAIAGKPTPKLEAFNNHFITTGAPIVHDSPTWYYLNVGSLTNTPAQATALGYTVANNFAPLDATKPTVNAGTNTSAVVTADRLGVSRPKGAVYDIGAYEYDGTPPPPPDPVPGTLLLSEATAVVSEEAGTVTVTVTRTGGSDDVVGCSYATANGTAVAGVNYTAKSGNIAWADGDSADKSFTVTILDANTADNLTFTVTLSAPQGGATIGTPSVQEITVLGSGEPPPPPLGYLPGSTWNAVDGTITAPMVAHAGGYVYQPYQTGDPANGGTLTITFTNAAGWYRFDTTVDCVDTANDSWWVTTNSAPVLNPDYVWDVLPTPTVGVESRTVGHRDSGTFNAPESPTWTIYLSEGTPESPNSVKFVGRETGKIYTVSLVPVYIPPPPDPEDPDPPPPTPVTILSLAGVSAGYYTAGSVIPLTCRFSTNVTVTGTPLLSLNNGAVASYASGSDTTDLVFNYTVVSGDDCTLLDYASTSALTLNDGTIRNDATDAELTLPSPGGPGSISHATAITVDTIAPTVTLTISDPELVLTNDVAIWLTVRFDDVNFSSADLHTSDVILTTTGTATATIGASETMDAIQTITLSNPSGEGTLTVSIPAGTATDLAGNLAPAAGPTNPIEVVALGPAIRHTIIIRSGEFRHLIILRRP